MISSKLARALAKAKRRPDYRAQLWERLGYKLGVIPEANLSLSDDSVELPSVQHQPRATRVRDILFENSPYDGFDPYPYAEDMQGWGSDALMLAQAIHLLEPTRICEVGSWKGRSAIHMARTIKELNLSTEIICVDTWLGSPEHWLHHEDHPRASLKILNGMPQLYYTFLANVVRSGVADVITPFPMTSENAAVVFAELGIRFDIIYLDAAHEYNPVKRDINAYYELLETDGLLIGDDFLIWTGVTKAAEDFARERNLRLIGVRGKFVIPKGQKYADITFTF